MPAKSGIEAEFLPSSRPIAAGDHRHVGHADIVLLVLLIIITVVVIDIMIIGTALISIMMMIMGIGAHMLLGPSPRERHLPARPHRVEVRF